MSYAEFSGFPQDALAFLYELSANNNKSWFEANKERYRSTVLAHVPAFVTALGERLQAEISAAIVYDPRINGAGTMMRIYRDVRFSRDKTPYKTNVAFIFWEGTRKKMENPSFGFQFGTWGAGLYGGVFGFTKDLLEAYRQAVIDDRLGAELESAIDAVRSADGYDIAGDTLKNVPVGYDPDHPRAALLKYKGLHATCPSFDIGIVTTPALVDVCFERCKQMAPIQQWLAKVDRMALG